MGASKTSLREAAPTRPVWAHTQVQSSIPERRAPVSNPPTISRNNRGADRARKFLWPVAIIVFLLTALYPAIDLIRPDGEMLGILGFLVYIGIALVTGVGVFALVLPWALRRESAGAVALTLSTAGLLFAPGFLGWIPTSAGCRRSAARLGRARRGQRSQALTRRFRDRCARHDRQRGLLCRCVHLR